MSLAHELKMQRLKGYWTSRASRKQHLKKNAKSIITMLGIVYLGYNGSKHLKLKYKKEYVHMAAGFVIVLLGIGIRFWGW